MNLTLWINEPSLGWTNRSNYIWEIYGPTWSGQRGERGPAAITLVIPIGDSYAPTLGCQVKLELSGNVRFFGTIEDYEYKWIGQDGYRGITVNAVTLKQALDTIRVQPQSFSSTDAGTVVTTLLGQYPSLPFTLGTIDAGADIESFNVAYDVLSDVIQQLATTSGFIWDIDPDTQTFFFRAPDTVTSPVTIISESVQWETLDYSIRRSDFRDRQISKTSWAAFSPSVEVFAGDGHTTSFTLRNPIDHMVSSTITTSTRATVTGIYTGQPNNGDSLSVGNLPYSFVTTLDNTQFGEVLIGASANATWQNFLDAINATMSLAGSTYSLPTWENGSVNSITALDTANGQFVLTAKQPGTAANNIPVSESVTNFSWHGGSQTAPGPPPDPVAGASPTNPIVFSQIVDVAATLPGGHSFTLGGITYTFVAVLNNAVPYQIQVGTLNGKLGACYDAINGNPLHAGITYSSATTANPKARMGVLRAFGTISPIREFIAVCANILAIDPSPGTPSPTYPTNTETVNFFSVTPTAAGTDDISAAGAVTAQDSPSTGTTADPAAIVSWSTGFTDIVAQVAPAAGTSLVISYYRIGADCIAVEDSTLVAQRAAIEHGTGRIDAMTDDSQNTDAFDALSKAQATLATFGIFPEQLTFQTYTSGLIPGDLLPINLIRPITAPALVNGTDKWVIQEVKAQYVEGMDYCVGYTIRYDVTLISSNQIQSDVQFVERLAQTGGSGIGSSGPKISKSATDSGGTGTGTNSEPVEEIPIGIQNGLNRTFRLTWVPRVFPNPDHQIVRLTRNGNLQNPFGYSSPAVDPDFTIADNVITFRVAPDINDALLALYWPDVGTPTKGALKSATISVVTKWSIVPSPSFAGIAEAFFKATSGFSSADTVENSNDTQLHPQQTFTHTLTGFTTAALTTCHAFFRIDGSTSSGSGGPGTGGIYDIYDCYLTLTYANADPSLPDIVEHYRPANYTIYPGSGVDTITVGVVPSAEINRWHTSGLSTFSTLDFTGFTLS